MANRDLNKLFKKAFKGAGDVNVLNLRSLLSQMIRQMEETSSKQVSQHDVESLGGEIIQNREDLQSLRETLQKYPGPDQLREEVRSLTETPQGDPDPDRDREESLREPPPKYPDPGQYVKEVRALREEFQKYPDPEMLSQCVTWDVMQSALLSETQSLREELLNSGPVDPGVAQTEPPEIPSEKLSEVKSSLESLVNETSQHRAVIESLVDELNQHKALTERLVDETSQHRALIENLVNESSQHRALIDDLTVKHDSLEDMLLNQRPEMETTSATPESSDSHREASHELRQQIFSVRKSVKKQEEDIKKLSAKVTLCEERNTHEDPPDKLNITGMIENTVMSLIPKFLQDEAEQEQTKDRSASTASLVETENEVKFLFKLHEQLQEEVKRLVCKQMVRDTETVEAVANLQSTILQLQREKQSHFDKHTEDTKNLEGRVSRLQSDCVSKQSKLTIEMETKVTKADVNSILKRQLKEHAMPQEADDAAGLRKPLGERFQCLSCDKPVLKHMPRPPWMQKPTYPRYPPVETTCHSSSYTVPALEQCNRNQDTETLIYEGHSTEIPPRNCVRKATLTPASQHRTINTTDVHPSSQTVAKGRTRGVVQMARRNCDTCDPVGKIQLPQLEVKPIVVLPPIHKKQRKSMNASASKKKAGDTGRMGHPGMPVLR